MKITSAYANKLLRQLNEDKNYWLRQENEGCTYTAATGEEPLIPDYDYQTVFSAIEEINAKIATLKHAINCYNVSTALVLHDGSSMTIDEALVTMAQLNNRKDDLAAMRARPPKKRTGSSYRGSSTVIEYTYINYDLAQVKADYQRISERIMEIQMKLDQLNQTVEFEVDL